MRVLIACEARNLAAANERKAPSLQRFVAIQGVERKQNLSDLAPYCCLVAAEAVKHKVGQISQTQKATGEFSGRIDIRIGGGGNGTEFSFRCVGSAVRCCISVKAARSKS